MGKRIIQQARGHGSLTYQVRKRAYIYRIDYPKEEGKAKVLELFNSCAHSSPLAKILFNGKTYYIPAFSGMVEGQGIKIGGKEIENGNVLLLKDIPVGTNIFNIEIRPKSGGKLVRASGLTAIVTKKALGKVSIMMPSKKEISLDENCRASIGMSAGEGRKEKPIIKAGKKWYMMKARNKLWPRTSAVKMNAIDHPFGSGRGKRIKPKIAKRNAPAGARVGLIRPRRTGRKKR
ncbi:50S ribosomal protein L2 [Candidatus Pacearchaeota archaeon]|nr:50S ribosomal protein L2 [Candidatus Pacearchaeota archaeon]